MRVFAGSVARVATRFTLVLCALLVSACAGNVSPEAYSRLTQDLLSKGHLRVDPNPKDAPFDATGLARNFRDVTFQYEFHFDGDRIVDEPLPKPLKRWRGTIRYKLTGDAHTPEDAREISDLTERLGALTGLTFIQTDHAHDMLISIASPEGRKQISQQFADRDMPVYKERYDIWRETPGWMCGATLSASNADRSRLVYAHIFIGSEVNGLLRKACIQEEIVQSLGLTNDSDLARPSIFNDDQEFAVLTEHDEVLLQVLYDPRLKPGMPADQAMPIVRRILQELTPDRSGALT
ncbi:MAG: DUF2927 domain-containing protein [Pseudomonadota bacterium]